MKPYIRVPILNDEYAVVVCWGEDWELVKVLRHFGYPDAEHLVESRGGRGSCYHRGGCHPVVALPGVPVTPGEHGTMAHEAVHAVSNVMGTIGAVFEDEVVAHSVGAVIRIALAYIESHAPSPQP